MTPNEKTLNGHWLHHLTPPVRGALSRAIQSDYVHLITLDGAQMKTMDGLFAEYANALHTPSEHPSTWDDLAAILADLHWLEPGNYLLLITSAYHLLGDSPEYFSEFRRILDLQGRHWTESFTEGHPWGYGQIPHHTLLSTQHTINLADPLAEVSLSGSLKPVVHSAAGKLPT